jgi:hypothetical protein
MMISEHPVRSESESREFIDTLQTNLPFLQHARLFQWLYLRNPEGRALVWVATDSETHRIIGIAAAFPRRTYYCGAEVRSYVLGDFCIDAGHRSLGLAVSLQRACLEGLSGGAGIFAFDFPSRNMLAVYKRMQIDANATMIRHAKPLRADRKIAERVPVGAVARGLSVVVNAGLRLRDNGLKRTGDWMVAADSGPWGEEFTQAAREWSPGTGVCVLRTADYLNWRYREHPTQSYEMLAARQGGKLRGYLILHMSGEDCVIDDLMADDDEVRGILLAEATALGRKRHVHTLNLPWLSTHPGSQLLEKCGFRPRESSPVVIMALPQATQYQIRPAEDQWYLTNGDWES